MLVGTQFRKIDETQYVKVTGVVLPSVNQETMTLGVIVDSQFTFKVHWNAVAKACNYHIWSSVRYDICRHQLHTRL